MAEEKKQAEEAEATQAKVKATVQEPKEFLEKFKWTK